MQQPYSQVVFQAGHSASRKYSFKPLTSVENDTSRNVVILEEAHTEQEAIVAQLFAEVLGVERLSVDDDFSGLAVTQFWLFNCRIK